MERSTKDKILDFAEILMTEKGFHGFSYSHIAIEIDIRKASVHHHFSTKEHLGIALIHRYMGRLEKWVEKHRESSPLERIQALIQMYKHLSHEGTRVCPYSALTAEFPTISENIQKEVAQVSQRIEAWVTATIQEGHQSNIFQSKNPAIDARFIITSLSGLLQHVRISKNTAEFDEVGSHIVQYLLKENS